MIRGIGVLALMCLLVAASIGLAGGGPDWLRYVGTSVLFALLMLILTQLSNLPDKNEYRIIAQASAAGATEAAEEPHREL